MTFIPLFIWAIIGVMMLYDYIKEDECRWFSYWITYIALMIMLINRAVVNYIG